MIPGSPNLMMMAGGADPLDELGVVARSLRLRSTAAGHLSQLFAAAGDPQKCTFHFQLKRPRIGGNDLIYAVRIAGSQYFYFGIVSDDTFQVMEYAGTINVNLATARKFRDPIGHWDITIDIDTTQPVAADRIKILVDDVQETAFTSATYPSLNYNFIYLGSAAYPHYISWAGSPGVVGGADIIVSNFSRIDGQVLPPTAFGKRHPNTKQFRPFGKAVVKALADAGGAQSFFLTFDDPTNLTTLCADASSHGNNFTANNVSLTAGVTYDSLKDTSTDNFPTLNPIDKTPGAGTLSDGNLTFTWSSTGTVCRATQSGKVGKLWAEQTIGAAGGNIHFGLSKNGSDLSGSANGIYYRSDGQKIINGVASAYGATYTTGDVIAAAPDMDAGAITFYKQTGGAGDFVSQGSISFDFSAGFSFAIYNASGTTVYLNFGQLIFGYVARHGALPAGFNALCTKNLPLPPIPKSESAFVARTDSGANIIAAIAAAAPWADWLRIYKRRDPVAERWLWQFSDDAGYCLNSNNTAPKDVFPALAGPSYVGYTFKVAAENGIATGRLVHVNGVSDTINDGLASSRKMVILRNEGTGVWYTYHPDLTAGKLIYLEQVSGETTDATINSVTSSGFTVAAALASGTYRWISIAEKDGFMKLGKYVGTGAADGPLASSGHTPRMFFEKRIDPTGGNYYTYDAARNAYNGMDLELDIDGSMGETAAGGESVDFVSNAIKVRRSGVNINNSGGIYVYFSPAAFPFRYANAR